MEYPTTVAKKIPGRVLLNTYMISLICKIDSFDTSHLHEQIRSNHKFLFQQGVFL